MATITGTPNDDTLPGTAGDDTLDGLNGNDTANLASASSGAVFSLDAQGRWVVTSGQGVDTLASIERVNLNGEVITLGHSELRVNATTANDQFAPSVTALADGGWLVSWTSSQEETPGNYSYGIYQQRYTSTGVATGGEVRVNATTTYDQYSPSVTALADGGWLVSWMSYNQDDPGSYSWGIYQQRYTSTGVATGGEVRVNATTSNNQEQPSVTALADGGWLVSWQSYQEETPGNYGYGIYQQRYTSAGVATGGEVRVNATTANHQYSPSVTALADGGWLVSWTSYQEETPGNYGYGIYQQRYTSAGVATGGEVRVNATTANDQYNPSVTALADGGWLVSWQSYQEETPGNYGYGIYQQRYTSAGVATGGEVRVNATTANHQYSPSVTALADGGWLVSWTSYQEETPGNYGYGIYQQRYTSAGVATGGEVRVNATTANDQYNPSVTALADGGWLVSWMSYQEETPGNYGYGIYQQRFDASGAAIVSGLVLTGDSADNTLVFSGADPIEIEGAGGADTLQGGSGDDTLNGGADTDTVQTPDTQSALSWTLGDDGRLVLNGGAATGHDTVVAIEQVLAADGAIGVALANTETRVNATTANDQYNPSVTALADGGWLVSWMSFQEETPGNYSWGIYQQRYTSTGVATGGEVRVNATTTYDQYSPSVTALADGGWLVSWMSYNQDDPGSYSWGIYQQRYTSTGVATGGEVRVNATTANDQYNPSVTALADGGWLVSWMSNYQDDPGSYGWGIYQQRYTSTGVATGGEVRVNATTANDQYNPSVTALADGGWLVSWQSYQEETPGNYGYGIYQQRYTSAGVATGGEVRVNATTANDQYNPSVTALADGGWLVSWMSYNQDDPGNYDYGIYQQRYTSTGVATGGEVRVNATTANHQYSPSVTALADGGWLVSWTSYQEETPGNYGYGIYQQRYTSAGVATGGEVRVNATTANDQFNPSVTALADGGWLVSWMSNYQDGVGWGIYQQRFDADGLREGHLTLTGDASDSVLRMASAAEGVELIGAAGADTLAGGAFADRLSGGTGADTFEFAASGNGTDRITDFEVGDRIAIAGAAFSGHTITDGNGGAVAQNDIQVSHSATRTVLHIGTDTVPGADVEVVLDGLWDTAKFVASGNQISYQINSAPTATNLDAPETYTEDTPLNLTNIVVADVDSPNVTVTLTLSDPTAGALSTGNSNSVNSTYNPATGVWSASGAIADVNALLAGVTFTPTANFNGNFTIATSVSDGVAPALTGTKNFTGTAVNDAPVLNASQSPALATVAEDAGAPSGAVGTLVSSLVDFASPAGQVDNVSDVDTGALLGIALTGTHTANGTWFYSTNGGTNWLAVGAVSDSSALLLGADAVTRVYFQPSANFNGTVSSAITFRAWDQTTGTAGSKVNTVSNGGTTAFSASTDTASIVVSPVNDAPTGGAAITGTPVQGRVLTADTHTLADVDGLGTLHYQWLRGGVAIAGAADAPTYTTTLADVGARISLRVSYTDGDHTAESVLSPDTATIGAPLAPPPGLPTLIGPNQGIGNDKLVGSNLAEVLLGGAAVDMLVGGGGNDWLDGGADMDTMSGQSGNDTYVVDNEWDQVYEDIDAGTDTVISSVRFVLGPNLENLYLSGVANINGAGNASANLIIGNAGNNTLAGGLGNDTLIGGDGRDVFVFDTAPSAANRDTIQNFIVADDTIQLSRAVFSALATGVLATGAFVTGAAALDANDRIIYNSATGALLYDADGSGAGAAVQFATLIGVVGTLSAADFVVV